MRNPFLLQLSERADHTWQEHRKTAFITLLVLHTFATICYLPKLPHILALLFYVPQGERARTILEGFKRGGFDTLFPGLWSPIPEDLALRFYILSILLAILIAWGLRRCVSTWLSRERAWYVLTMAALLPPLTLLHELPFLGIRNPIATTLLLLGWVPLLLPSRPMPRHGPLFLVGSITLSTAIIVSITSETFFKVLSPITFALAITLSCIIAKSTRWHNSWLVGVLTLLTIFLVTLGAQMRIDNDYTLIHHGYFLGPIIEYLHGGGHPFVDTNAQYGGGLTVVIAQYFRLIGFVSPDAFLLLLKVLTLIQYLLTAYLCQSLFKSRLLTLLTVIAALVFVVLSHGAGYYSNPSMGFFRFGLIYVILALFTLAKETSWFRPRYLEHSIALTLAVGTLFSFENFFYLVPSVLLGFGFSRSWKAALKVGALWLLYTLTLFVLPTLSRDGIDFSRYLEYAQLYGYAFAVHGLYNREIVWTLWYAVAVAFVVRMVVDRSQDERISILALFALLSFSYFVMRALGTNFTFASLPFLILMIYGLSRIQARHMRPLLLGCAFAVLLSSAHNSEILQGTQKLVSMRDLLAFNPASSNFPLKEEAFRRKFCPPGLEDFKKYAQGNGIPLMSLDPKAFLIYSCLRMHNSYRLNPFTQTAISEKAVDRLLQVEAPRIANPLLLVDTAMQPVFQHNELEVTLLQDLLTLKKFVPREEVTIAERTYRIFESGSSS